MLKARKACLIFFISLLPFTALAQRGSVYNGLSVKGFAGLSTLYGDISNPGLGAFGDAQLGFGLSGIKKFSSFFGVEVRYASANLSTVLTDVNEQYTGQVSEIGLAARLEPLPAVGPNGMRRLYPYLRFGISNASYRAIRWNTITSQVIEPSFGYNLTDMTPGPRTNALSFPLALGVGIRINGKLSLELEYNHSILNTDFLDTRQVPGGFNDMFGLTSIGIRYSFEPVFQSGLPRSRDEEAQFGDPLLSANRVPTANLQTREDRKEPIDPFLNEIPFSDVFVESIIPDYPVSGDLFEVLLRIHKGDYTGPATLIQTLPDGFTAIEAPLRHALLSFDNRQVTITWNQMPVDTLVTVRYHIHIDNKVSGPHVINGRIYYSQPDGNQSYRFVNQFLVTNQNEMKMDQKFMDILAERKSTSNPYSTSVSVQKKRESELDRVVQDLMKNYEQTGAAYPSGFNDPLQPSAGSGIERTVIPEDELDRKIQGLIGQLGPYSASGSTGQVDELIQTYGQTGEIRISSMNQPLQASQLEKKLLTEEELDRRIQNLIAGQASASGGWEEAQSPSTFVGKPGVEFRVQIGAFQTRNDYTRLAAKYRIRDAVAEEYHNGMYKYTVGSLNSYREAQQYRDAFIQRTGILSAFIVEYNNGSRQAGISHR